MIWTGNYTIVVDTSTLPQDPRIRYEADIPEGTSVTVEYACTEDSETPPETWTAVDNRDLLVIDKAHLWLRYVLETEDNAITPTLHEVWLEDKSSDPTTIMLIMKPLKRFHNVAGDLTVKYDMVLGTLQGKGGAVKSFEQGFTPVGLAPKPNPHDPERIEIANIEVDADLIRIYYTDCQAPLERIGIADISATGTLIHIDDI